MEPVFFFIGVLLILFIVLMAASKSKSSDNQSADFPLSLSSEDHVRGRSVSSEQGMTDEEFEQLIHEVQERTGCVKGFYSKVAGTSHPNSDRTSRRRIIARCTELEHLDLVREPENPYDANAVAVVRRSNREQLGYLDARLAGEVTRNINKYGSYWTAVFRRATHVPDTGKVAGAVIYVMCIPKEPTPGKDNKA